MPSPVAHSMAGLALTAALWIPSLRPGREGWRDLLGRPGLWLGAVVLACLPDLDYLPGLLAGDFNAYHHLATHSLLWAALSGTGIVLVAAAARAYWSARFALWVLLLIGSHLAMDMLTADGRAPYGIPLAWPWSWEAFQFGWQPFAAFQKKDWQDLWQWANVRVLARELALTVPFLAGVLFWKRRSTNGGQPCESR